MLVSLKNVLHKADFSFIRCQLLSPHIFNTLCWQREVRTGKFPCIRSVMLVSGKPLWGRNAHWASSIFVTEPRFHPKGGPAEKLRLLGLRCLANIVSKTNDESLPVTSGKTTRVLPMTKFKPENTHWSLESLYASLGAWWHALNASPLPRSTGVGVSVVFRYHEMKCVNLLDGLHVSEDQYKIAYGGRVH